MLVCWRTNPAEIAANDLFIIQSNKLITVEDTQKREYIDTSDIVKMNTIPEALQLF